MSDHFQPSSPLDPVAEQFVTIFRGPPLAEAFATGDPNQIRPVLKALAAYNQPRPVEHVADYRIPVADGDIGARLYRPVPKPPALIVWSHGGGFTIGSVDEADSFVRAFALTTGCAVLSVDYRLAPEHKFPTAVDDVLAATLWAAKRRAELAGGDVPLIMGGDSAGANLSTVITRKLHESKACTIAANVLAYPCTDVYGAPSLKRFVPPFLSLAECDWFFDNYLPNEAARSHPDFAPLLAGNLGVLPPTFMLTADHDILTEQGLAYGKKLAAAGVDVKYSHAPGMIHGFLTIDMFFDGAAGNAMAEIRDFIASVVRR
jgi:acetyl esterase